MKKATRLVGIVLLQALTGLLTGDAVGSAFRFEQNVTTVSETQSGITLWVIRSPSTNQESVDFATVPVSATAGLDYTAVSGTLVFEMRTAQRAIFIPILNDGLEEANETLRVVLTNANSGSSLGNLRM
jgi:hypothetical protein